MLAETPMVPFKETLMKTPRLEVVKDGNPPGLMPRFAVDIDSTLYPFETPAREAFQKLYDESGNREYLKGLYHPWTEFRSPADVCGIDTWMRVIEMCHKPEVIEAQVPYPGAAETLKDLADHGYELLYISNRSPEAAKATQNWLEKWKFPLYNADVHCLMEDKKPFIAECQYLIDDRPKTLIQFIYDKDWDESRGKRKGLALMFDYNRALTDIPDIFLAPTWAGIASWLVRKNLLPHPTHVPLEAF
jgi:hypothetical protein